MGWKAEEGPELGAGDFIMSREILMEFADWLGLC